MEQGVIPDRIAYDDKLKGHFKVRLADALVNKFGESDWKRVAITHSLQGYITDHPRFLRSLRWGDLDYEGHVLELVDYLYNQRPRVLRTFLENDEVQEWFKENEPQLLAIWDDEGDPLVEALADALGEISDAAQSVNMTSYKNRIQQALPHDPPAAIGATKDMLEAVMRTILVERQAPHDVDNLDFPALTNKCLFTLGLKSSSPPSSEREKHIRQIVSSAQKMMEAANALRNYGGTGHGRAAGTDPNLSVVDAQLVAATGYVLAAWLLRHYQDAP